MGLCRSGRWWLPDAAISPIGVWIVTPAVEFGQFIQGEAELRQWRRREPRWGLQWRRVRRAGNASPGIRPGPVTAVRPRARGMEALFRPPVSEGYLDGPTPPE